MDESGQVRLVEMILSTIVMTLALLMIMNLTAPLRSIYLRETSDLRRLAYNVLNSLSETGMFEDLIMTKRLKGDPWEDELSLFLSMNLPPNIVFKLDVYEYLVLRNGTTKWVKLNSKPITNLMRWDESKVIEAESITYTYVCLRGADEYRGIFLKFELVLGYGG